tara:strand:+ start:33346 stop:35010 length:1665 start_codon:yes stop_codon:yes gene_type:complete
MLVDINERALATGKNVDAAIKLAEWARTADYDSVVKAYAECHRDPNIDDSFIRTLAQCDRFYLGVFICNRHDMLHPWIYERCREVESNKDDHLDLWARFHYKSTIITFLGCVQEILCNPDITIGILSYSARQAKPFLRQIMQEFESNEKLQDLFSDILWKNPKHQAPKWAENEGICVNRFANPKEQTVEAHGLVDGQPTGRHFSLIVYDDVVVQESITTPEQIKKTTTQWELSLNLGSTHDPRYQYAGTRYAYGDTYGTILQRAAVKPRIHPATYNGQMDGEPVFLAEKRWEEIKKTTSTYTVACQQLLNPIIGSDVSFKQEWWNEWEVRPYTLNVYIMVDPAHSKKKESNRTAFAVVGVDANFNKYLLDGACHRMSLSEKWEMLKRLRQKWKRAPGVREVKIGYERYGAQSDIEHFKAMMSADGSNFPIYELNWVGGGGSQSKRDRIQRLEPDLKDGSFFFPYPTDEKMLTSYQRDFKERKQSFLISKKIICIDEERKTYDLTKWVKDNEYNLFPTIHPDFLDALSRVYDIDPMPPRSGNRGRSLEPPAEARY